MFGFGKKKCEYCRSAIKEGMEVLRDVRRPGYVGTFQKGFCSEEHADMYVKETESVHKKGGGCCC